MKRLFFLVVIFCCNLFNVFNIEAQTVTAITGSNSITYSVSQLVVPSSGVAGSLSEAVEIILNGDWTAANFLTFKKAIKPWWDAWDNTAGNYVLKSVDMSGVTSLTGNFNPSSKAADAEGLTYLFDHCYALENVVMPNVIPNGPVSFFKTFNDCYELQSMDLSLFTNISAMNGVIRNCYVLTSLTLPSTENLYNETSGVSFNAAFQGCVSLKSLDLSHFTNISDIGWLVRSCDAIEEVILPTRNTYTGSVTLQNAFYGCRNLKNIYNLDGFSKVSNLISAFRECSSLVEVKLGFNPNSIANLATSFDEINPDCYKWFVTTPEVSDIPQTWKNYYNDQTTQYYYGNFVLPFAVAAVSAPAIVNVGTTHIFSRPAITQPYAASEGNSIWRLIYKPNSYSPVTTLIESPTPTENITFDKVGYYTISCGIKSPNGTTYWSVETPITVIDVANGSY